MLSMSLEPGIEPMTCLSHQALTPVLICHVKSADGYYLCAFEHLCGLLGPISALQIIFIIIIIIIIIIVII